MRRNLRLNGAILTFICRAGLTIAMALAAFSSPAPAKAQSAPPDPSKLIKIHVDARRAPEKVLFATDAYPFSEEMSWEEAGWVAATTGRQALGLALTEMMHDGEITRDRAIEIARMVLRDNARKLYRLP